MVRFRLWANVLSGILLASALQGCLLTRVLESKAQLCDEQPSRVVVTRQPGSGLRVVFETPTLTERDVVWIVGHEPTEVTGGNGVRKLSYEALPIHRQLDRTTSLVVRLAFVHRDGEYRLVAVEIPDKFNAILSPPLVEAAVRVVCKTRIGVVPPSATFDLAAVDRATLPNRDALTRLLGTPTAAVARAGDIAYQYCLAPCKPDASMVANLKFSFGDDGELHRADGRYFRYAVMVDINAAKATATIELQ